MAVVVLIASIAAWGPFAGSSLARPGSPRMDGVGITLAAGLFETMVLLAVRSAGRHAGEAA